MCSTGREQNVQAPRASACTHQSLFGVCHASCFQIIIHPEWLGIQSDWLEPIYVSTLTLINIPNKRK